MRGRLPSVRKVKGAASVLCNSIGHLGSVCPYGEGGCVCAV